MKKSDVSCGLAGGQMCLGTQREAFSRMVAHSLNDAERAVMFNIVDSRRRLFVFWVGMIHSCRCVDQWNEPCIRELTYPNPTLALSDMSLPNQAVPAILH